MKSCYVFTQPPADFSPRVEAAGCYMECDGQLLFLQRPATQKYESCWGVPAGKLEVGESPRSAVIREVFEETGIALYDNEVFSLGALYMRLPHVDYMFHMFHTKMLAQPDVILSNEHQNFTWVTCEQALRIDLMPGAAEALKHYRQMTDQPMV